MIFIGGFAIDASIRETATYTSLISEDPIETGSDITDHVRNKKPDLIIEAIVTDFPTGDMVEYRNETSIPTEDALAHLIALREERQPFTVTSALGIFENVVFRSLSIPRDNRTGAALGFTATLKQIEIVDVERTTVKVSVPRAQRKKKKGTKASKANATAAAAKRTQNALATVPFTKQTIAGAAADMVTAWRPF